METVNVNRKVYELVFMRCWEARFFSHLDLMRGISRALRRTGLPLYFTEGFNPKPKMSYLSHPLSTGHTSECERLLFELAGDVPETEVDALVRGELPPGLVVGAIVRVPFESRKSNPAVRLEYYVLIRKNAAVGASAWQGGGFFPAELSPRELSKVETARMRMFADGTDAAAFFSEYFGGAFAIEVPGGQEYRKPEKWLGLPEPPVAGELHFHRHGEIAIGSLSPSAT
jgi:hypothetical protein